MTLQLPDLREVGKLIQFGLRPDARPIAEPEYQDLITRYEDSTEFRAAVREVVAGLGLRILQASRMGLVLAPLSDSVFGMNWSDYRTAKYSSADGRLIGGLIHIAILATIFPRAQDLDEDPTIVRSPVTAEEVEATLRELCAALEEEARGKPDPAHSEVGLYEAWRVYQKRSSAVQTPSGQRSPKATRTLIEDGLEFLRKHGFFIRRKSEGKDVYHATWRYQVMVQEFSAEPIYAAIRALLNRPATLEEK